jgi:hypothetical protein
MSFERVNKLADGRDIPARRHALNPGWWLVDRDGV